MIIQPLDIVIVEGKWYNPIHAMIMWRSLSRDVHCFVIRDVNGRIFDPTIGGVLDSHIREYQHSKIKVLRYRFQFDTDRVMKWCIEEQKNSKGYDYVAWLGFALGLKPLEDEHRYYCSEFCYWMWQENGYKLTNEDQIFYYPCNLTQNTNFALTYWDEAKFLIKELR